MARKPKFKVGDVEVSHKKIEGNEAQNIDEEKVSEPTSEKAKSSYHENVKPTSGDALADHPKFAKFKQGEK